MTLRLTSAALAVLLTSAALPVLAGEMSSKEEPSQMLCVDFQPEGFQAYPPEPGDKAAIEEAWGQTLPEGLIGIGGLDAYGWARLCRDAQDEPGLLRGEYWDARLHYKGQWQVMPSAQHPDWPDGLFRDFSMSHFEEGRGLVLQNAKRLEDPPDLLIVRPLGPLTFVWDRPAKQD